MHSIFCSNFQFKPSFEFKIVIDPLSDAGMQHRFEFENDIIKRMKQLMTECYSKKPENYCLKLLFDSSFFWE